MAMPGGGGMPPQQSMMSPHHQQQMVAQQQHQQQQQAAVAAAQAAAAAAAQQAAQGHPMMGGGPGPGPPHPQQQQQQGPLGPGGPQPPPQQGGPPQGGPPNAQNPSGGGGGGGGQLSQQQSQQEQQKVENISKARALVPHLKDSLLNVMRNAAMAISANNMIDSGTKQVDYDVSRFDKSLEEFFSLLDQLEVNLRTSVECLNQSGQSAKYLPVPVTPNKTDNSMTYPQYIELVKGQIAYAKEIHGALAEASQRLSDV